MYGIMSPYIAACQPYKPFAIASWSDTGKKSGKPIHPRLRQVEEQTTLIYPKLDIITHGPGVFEIVENHIGDTYRSIYTVRFAGAIYVLHAFQKKSKTGIKTPSEDMKLIRERLIRAREDYEGRS